MNHHPEKRGVLSFFFFWGGPSGSLRAGSNLPGEMNSRAFQRWMPPSLFFHKLRGSQVTIWNNYWGQSSWLAWVSGITQMLNFMAHNKCFEKKNLLKVASFHFT